MSTGTEPRLAEDEYREFERGSPTKHKFFDREIIAVAGGNPAPRCPCGQLQSMVTTSPSARCPIRLNISWSMSNDRRCTEPSPNRPLIPPGWVEPKQNP